MHEKPKLELREFFARIDPQAFTQRVLSLLPGITGADPSEFERRAVEAADAMPLLRELARQQHHAAATQQDRDRIVLVTVGIIALHALAEDMGYEW